MKHFGHVIVTSPDGEIVYDGTEVSVELRLSDSDRTINVFVRAKEDVEIDYSLLNDIVYEED
jgi:hypothetical protein